MLKLFALTTLAVLTTALSAIAGPVDKNPVVAPVEAYDPLKHVEIDFESGVLWRVGNNGTPLDYTILAQMLTIKSPEWFGTDLAGGRLGFRHRFSLLIEPIIEGPEDYYLGFAGSGSLEWWNAPRNFSLFFAAGGGLGWMDSQGPEVEGAAGQDLNFNWFLYSGARYMFCKHGSVALGVYYQHASNMGMDDVNPGIDALGPMLSIGWHF